MTDWRDAALCRHRGGLWFADGARDAMAERVAVRVCSRCPVRGECAALALELIEHQPGQLVGVWSGVNVSGPRGAVVAELQRHASPQNLTVS